MDSQSQVNAFARIVIAPASSSFLPVGKGSQNCAFLKVQTSL
jgi:hypothetical protein